jgi:hypothetical protein
MQFTIILIIIYNYETIIAELITPPTWYRSDSVRFAPL